MIIGNPSTHVGCFAPTIIASDDPDECGQHIWKNRSIMLTFYCPKCWEIVEQTDKRCPHCGFDLSTFNQLAFEDKLLAALTHSVPERRIMAAQILGNIGSQRALPVFHEIVDQQEMDYFFMRAVLLAAAKIDHPDRERILRKASEHPSELISNLAKELVEQLSRGKELGEWDRHTG